MEEAVTARKRPWFQLHLSTCVVLMFVAGAYIGANLLEYAPGYSVNLDSDDVLDYDKYYGWPSVAMRGYIHIENTCPPSTIPKSAAHDWRREWILTGVAINAIVLIDILAASSLACEWFRRRRERARAGQEPIP